MLCMRGRCGGPRIWQAGRGRVVPSAGLDRVWRSVALLRLEEQSVLFDLDELGDLVLNLCGWEVARVDLNRSWDFAAGVANFDLDS